MFYPIQHRLWMSHVLPSSAYTSDFTIGVILEGSQLYRHTWLTVLLHWYNNADYWLLQPRGHS